MSNYIEQDKSEISKEGLVGTLLFHTLLLLLFLLMGVGMAWEPPKEGGIALNFGTDEAGWGEEQPMSGAGPQTVSTDLAEPTPESAAAAQPPTNTTTAANAALTEDSPDAPDIGVKDKKEKTQPNKNTANTTPKNQTTANNSGANNGQANTTNTSSSASSARPSVDPNSLFKGSSGNNASSHGNVPGGTGDMGNPMGGANGALEGGNPGPGGGGPSYALTGRKLLSVPPIDDSSQETGVVVVKIKVNRNGDVIEAQYTTSGSNTSSTVLKSKAIGAAKKTKFNNEPNAPEVQTGTMTFRFKVK